MSHSVDQFDFGRSVQKSPDSTKLFNVLTDHGEGMRVISKMSGFTPY